MRDFTNIASRGREVKQVTLSVLGNDVTKVNARFYALRERGSKPDDDDDVGMSLYFSKF